MPWVTVKADAHDRQSPIQAVFHSQILRRHIRDFGVWRVAVGPGIQMRQMSKVMKPGARRAITARSQDSTISFSSKG